MDIRDLELSSFRSFAVGPLQGMPVTKGTTIYSSDLNYIYIVTGNGHFGGDSFEVSYTVGSNVVIIPNNVLDWEGMSLYSESFPLGVAITGRTGVFREFTIATNAPSTKAELANFCPLNTLKVGSTGGGGAAVDVYQHTVRRNPAAEVMTTPQAVVKGSMWLSFSGKELYVAEASGHFGGDSFEVTFTAGSNLIIIPNNVLNWTGLKIFCDQFPEGVAIASKTANYQEYTIATPATVTARLKVNFAKFSVSEFVTSQPGSTFYPIRRSIDAEIITTPIFVKKGSVWLSFSGKEMYIAEQDGYYGGDHFDVTFTAGSNLVTFANNNLTWANQKLYCEQFPNGVAITSKTANFREYTIASNATVTGVQKANFNKFSTVTFVPSSGSTLFPINRSISADVLSTPLAVKKGAVWLSYSAKEMYIAEEDGFFGGDHFDVVYTAGSANVIIPNNVLVFTGMKLYCEQFPNGVAITAKTANFREYTIASNATVSKTMRSNFGKFSTVTFVPSTGADDFKVKASVDDGDANNAVPYTNPVPVKAGDMFQSVDKSEFYVVDQAGHYAGDNFEVQLTAGSPNVLIPNNVLVWSGLKLFCPSFPTGVTITAKTGTYQQYTLASNAPTTRKERANFCGIKTGVFLPFGGVGQRKVITNANNAIYPGKYYLAGTATNLPAASTATFLDVEQHGNTLIHFARLDTDALTAYVRRSADNGATYNAWRTS